MRKIWNANISTSQVAYVFGHSSSSYDELKGETISTLEDIQLCEEIQSVLVKDIQ